MVPEGGKITVIAVWRLARYRPELGQASTWSGQVFGFMGKVEEGQLPLLMKLPDTMSLRQALAPHSVVVPTWAEWNAHYGVGPPHLRHPINGEELVSMDGEPGDGRTLSVPRLQYVPQAWAPYFLGGMSPEQAMRLVRSLIDGLASEGQQAIAAPLERWCASACTRSGMIGVQCSHSKVQIAWVSPAGAMDRALGRWSSCRLAPYVWVAVPYPAGVAGCSMQGVPPALLGLPPPPMYKPSKEKVYSRFELERIRLACGLVPANYDLGRPPI
jgi:hypothetical protein